MAHRLPLPLDPVARPVEVDDGTLALCSMQGPGPTGRYAGEAVLWHLEEMDELHSRKIGSRGYGTHFGSEWIGQFKEPKAKRMLSKLHGMGIQSTNCVELMLLAIELYYEGLAELWEPQPGRFGFKGYETNPACQPEALAAIGRQITTRARDARSKGKYRVETARGSVAVNALREAEWRTVFFAKDATDAESKLTVKKGEGPLTGSPTVPGADTDTPVEVRVKMDHNIVGFARHTTKTLREQANVDLAKLDKVPFAVGFFEWGMHTFVFGYGQITEVHWDKGPKSHDVIEKSPFRTVAQQWSHGVLAIPPESWPF